MSRELAGGPFTGLAPEARERAGITDGLVRLREWVGEKGLTLLEGASRATEVPALPKGGVKGLLGFADLIQRFSARASQLQVGTLLEELVEELDLLRLLREEGPEALRGILENLASGVNSR